VAAARDRVLDFDIERTIRRTEALYRELADSTRPSAGR
jgi:hypothetical protein